MLELLLSLAHGSWRCSLGSRSVSLSIHLHVKPWQEWPEAKSSHQDSFLISSEHEKEPSSGTLT
jgi:hypothetical protein